MLPPGPARPPAPPPAPHPGVRRQVEPPGQLLRLFCAVLVCSGEIAALADFSVAMSSRSDSPKEERRRHEMMPTPPSQTSKMCLASLWFASKSCQPSTHHRNLLPGYLTKLLQNHTAYACDGDHLSLQCPRHSSISVQSAFYGQDHRACSGQGLAAQGDSLTCVAPTTFQKVLDECQDQRACRLLVNSRVFGPDLCPGSSKYLLVSFKCQPNELKNKTVCEGQELKLHCHPSKFLNIYAAAYGRRAQDADLCASGARPPPFDCLSYSASHVLARRCYGRQRCRVLVDDHHFGSPCLPGARKYLTVAYACVPRSILTAVDPALADQDPSLRQEDEDGGHEKSNRNRHVHRTHAGSCGAAGELMALIALRLGARASWRPPGLLLIVGRASGLLIRPRTELGPGLPVELASPCGSCGALGGERCFFFHIFIDVREEGGGREREKCP
ncbi:protein eva-1 homolog C isoform X5 [Myotis myotis]|uniref:protein eva-1 homolog C isoform X5 n=1 Tax=Myotis myotis TaxID=51298 RepID=UPI00174CBCD7|nr:protein eva-1 homolog C isoform X5 [Myotis myotis]